MYEILPFGPQYAQTECPGMQQQKLYVVLLTLLEFLFVFTSKFHTMKSNNEELKCAKVTELMRDIDEAQGQTMV